MEWWMWLKIGAYVVIAIYWVGFTAWFIYKLLNKFFGWPESKRPKKKETSLERYY